MTILTDVGFPRLELVDSQETVHVRFGSHGDGLLISTPAEANRLADELRRAAWHLEQVEMAKATARDKAAARFVNELRAVANGQWPGGTFAPVSQSHVQHTPITACVCSRVDSCTHGGAA